MPDKYQNTCTTLLSEGTTSRTFRGLGGTEHFIKIKAPLNLDFKAQMDFVEEQYKNVQKSLRIDPQTAVFRRVFLSDVLNQATLIKKSTLVEDTTATSIVQQSPLPGSKVELLAYHIGGSASLIKKRLSPNHLLVKNNGQRHLWSTQLCTSDSKSSISAEAQTRETFGNLIETLEDQGATLQDNCVRTWIFVKDVDLFYKAMVDSRRQLFAKQNLVDSTHYIASTGIEGACAHQNDLIAMDAY